VAGALTRQQFLTDSSADARDPVTSWTQLAIVSKFWFETVLDRWSIEHKNLINLRFLTFSVFVLC
jgi:hypothetical protein